MTQGHGIYSQGVSRNGQLAQWSERDDRLRSRSASPDIFVTSTFNRSSCFELAHDAPIESKHRGAAVSLADLRALMSPPLSPSRTSTLSRTPSSSFSPALPPISPIHTPKVLPHLATTYNYGWKGPTEKALIEQSTKEIAVRYGDAQHFNQDIRMKARPITTKRI